MDCSRFVLGLFLHVLACFDLFLEGERGPERFVC